VFLESINDSVLGSMYTRYKTPMLTNLSFEQVTFTPKLLLKDMDLGMAAAKALGVVMPAAAATRESVARLVGRGHEDIDFAVLLLETAKDAGLVLKPENVTMPDGLES
jgi:3-hydroxyisobutyrate dehydrogenase